MNIAKRVFRASLCATVLVASVPAFAQEFNIAEGRLLLVDAGAKRIVIETAQGSRLQCQFTGDTLVVGSDGSVLGIPATSQLTVHYEKGPKAFVATEIDVH
jgi:hypothetical protein